MGAGPRQPVAADDLLRLWGGLEVKSQAAAELLRTLRAKAELGRALRVRLSEFNETRPNCPLQPGSFKNPRSLLNRAVKNHVGTKRNEPVPLLWALNHGDKGNDPIYVVAWGRPNVATGELNADPYRNHLVFLQFTVTQSLGLSASALIDTLVEIDLRHYPGLTSEQARKINMKFVERLEACPATGRILVCDELPTPQVCGYWSWMPLAKEATYDDLVGGKISATDLDLGDVAAYSNGGVYDSYFDSLCMKRHDDAEFRLFAGSFMGAVLDLAQTHGAFIRRLCAEHWPGNQHSERFVQWLEMSKRAESPDGRILFDRPFYPFAKPLGRAAPAALVDLYRACVAGAPL